MIPSQGRPGHQARPDVTGSTARTASGLTYLGVHVTGKSYDVGDLVTAGGSAWYCGKATTSTPGSSHRLATDGQTWARRPGRSLMAVTLEDAKRHLHVTDPAQDAEVTYTLAHAAGHRSTYLGAGDRADALPDLVDRGTLLALAHFWEHRGDDGAPDDYVAALVDVNWTCSSSAARTAGAGLTMQTRYPAGQHRPGPAPGDVRDARRGRPGRRRRVHPRLGAALAGDLVCAPAPGDRQGHGTRAGRAPLITHRSVVVHGRYHPGVTLAARMTFEGQIYQVVSVINIDERDREMELIADLQE